MSASPRAAAGAALRETGRRTHVKGARDAVAASLILQVFLQKRRNEVQRQSLAGESS